MSFKELECNKIASALKWSANNLTASEIAKCRNTYAMILLNNSYFLSVYLRNIVNF